LLAHPLSASAVSLASLQHTVTYCNILQHTATNCVVRLSRLTSAPHCTALQHTATHCNTLQHTATHCNTLQHTAAHYNTLCSVLSASLASLSPSPPHCNTLQHTAPHYTTLQCTATRCALRRPPHSPLFLLPLRTPSQYRYNTFITWQQRAVISQFCHRLFPFLQYCRLIDLSNSGYSTAEAV